MPLGVLRPGPTLVIVVSRPSGWANCEVAPPPRQRARCISSPAAVTTRVPLAFAFGQKGRGEASPPAAGGTPLSLTLTAQVTRFPGRAASAPASPRDFLLETPASHHPPRSGTISDSLLRPYILIQTSSPASHRRTKPSPILGPCPPWPVTARRATPPAGHISAPSLNTCQSRFVPETPLELLHSRSPTTSPLPHPLNVLCPGFRPQTRRAPPPSCKAFP